MSGCYFQYLKIVFFYCVKISSCDIMACNACSIKIHAIFPMKNICWKRENIDSIGKSFTLIVILKEIYCI